MTNQLAINQKDVTTQILTRIDEMQGEGLALPKNYNPSNALQVAFLKIQEMKVRNQPILEVVTKKSVVESLLNMTLQGLSPAKNQCYFIPYGNQLQMQRSYFGTQAALKRLDGVNDIFAEVIREGETFEFKNDGGRKRLVKHEQTFETLDNKIVGAYAIIDTKEEGQLLEVMTKKQIDASWSQAKSSNIHNKFGDQMAMRTVINRAAKNYINTSDDSDLLVHAINDTTENEYDEEKRIRDVTETKSAEKAKGLLEDFKATVDLRESTPDPIEDVEVETESDGFTQEQINELNQMSEEQTNDEPFGNTEVENYTDLEEVSEVEEPEETSEDENLTIPQLKKELDKLGVQYDSHARKLELKDLLEMAQSGGVQNGLF